MKSIITLLLSVMSLLTHAQYSIYENFEAPYDGFRANFYIDTENCTHNIWQIGKPAKMIFYSAYSYPNAIVTDTLNPIPAHDTSIFYLTTVGAYRALATISFYYRINKDTNSFAKIEVSGDVGQNWIDPLKEDTTYDFFWASSKPSFDISTPGWQLFRLNMDTWSMSSPSWGLYPHYRTSDTMMYRFTFITGDSVDAYDGWMLDNFLGENTTRVSVGNAVVSQLQIFPNPSSGDIKVSPASQISPKDYILVYDVAGREVYKAEGICTDFHLPVPEGFYTLKYVGEKQTFVGKVVIRR